MRRIKQLGFSEFTFPGATHTRFAHSIGVYHNARKLMKVVEKFEGDKFNKDRADIILIASLLHDLGHGPFSHAFEEVRKGVFKEGNLSGEFEDHEAFTAKIIRNEDGEIFKTINDAKMINEVAKVFESKNPKDIYHAVVSSSFDADRLDYLVRDKYMTGTGTGAIDVDWLVDNLYKCQLSLAQDDDEPVDDDVIDTFVFKAKGRQAAEDFLLARYRLYKEVYLHKTTRGFEEMLSFILRQVADKAVNPNDLNLTVDDPLIVFFRDNDCIDNYLQLDDYTVWNVVKLISKSTKCRDIANIANRLLTRKHLFIIDVTADCVNDRLRLKNSLERLKRHVDEELGSKIFLDSPTVNLYSADDGVVEKIHKIIRVLDANGKPIEITDFEETIISNKLTRKTPLIRYYFLTEEDRNEARKAMDGR